MHLRSQNNVLSLKQETCHNELDQVSKLVTRVFSLHQGPPYPQLHMIEKLIWITKQIQKQEKEKENNLNRLSKK